MFGIEERIANARTRLHDAFMLKAGSILEPYKDKPPEAIPRTELVRATVLQDIAEIIKGTSEG
jgi:hypothetical protein